MQRTATPTQRVDHDGRGALLASRSENLPGSPSIVPVLPHVPEWMAVAPEAQDMISIALTYGGLIRAACSKRPSLSFSDVIQEVALILLTDAESHMDDSSGDLIPESVLRTALSQFKDQDNHPVENTDGVDLDSSRPYHASPEGLHTSGPASLHARYLHLPAFERAVVRAEAREMIGARDNDRNIYDAARDCLGVLIITDVDDDGREHRTVRYRSSSGTGTPQARFHSIIRDAEARVASSAAIPRRHHGTTVSARLKHARRCANDRIGRTIHAL